MTTLDLRAIDGVAARTKVECTRGDREVDDPVSHVRKTHVEVENRQCQPRH